MMQLIAYILISVLLVITYPLQAQTGESGNVREVLDIDIVMACRNHRSIGVSFGDSEEYKRRMRFCVTETQKNKLVREASAQVAAAELAQSYINTIIRLRIDAALRFIAARDQMESIVGVELTRSLIADQKENSITPDAKARLKRATAVDARTFRELDTALRKHQDAQASEDLARIAIQTYLSAEGPHIKEMPENRKKQILNELESIERRFQELFEPSGELGATFQQAEDRLDKIPEIAEAKATFASLREQVRKRLAFERTIALDIVGSAVSDIEL